MSEIYRGRSIRKGVMEGEALVMRGGFCFCGGVDPETGIVTEAGHEHYGKEITGKILVLSHLKGTAASMWFMVRLAANRKGPKAIVIPKADAILVGGVIIGEIPTVDSLSVNPIEVFRNGDILKVDGTKGIVERMSRQEG